MTRSIRWVLLTGLVATAACPPAWGQLPRRDERQRLNALANPFVRDGWVQSMVIGVVDRTGPRVYAYGRLAPGPGSTAPDGDTVYEIASITKPFTALLLAEMAERKEVALDDPVAKFLPPDVRTPATDRPITLLSLATHHSGLPRMPWNFRPKDPDNPYVDYSADDLLRFLPRAGVHPTGRFEYSNVGYGLLGHALSRRGGKPYEALVVERIAGPLGMADTRVALSPAMRSRLAPPFDADGEPDRNWDFDGIPGGGALRSTANDMLRFLAAQLDLPAGKGEARPATPDTLRRAIAASHEPRDTAQGEVQICLGWHLTKDGRHWHNGQTGGYHSFAAFDRRGGAGVLVLTNTATGHVDALGGRAMRVALGKEAAAVELPVPVTVAEGVLERYAGAYRLPDGSRLLVRRDGGRLVTSARGQAPVRLYPKGEAEFFAKATDSTGTFVRDASGRVTELVIRQDGKETRAPRAD
jgi:CubicO group peptidase (beta-lactamase class C family)